MLQNAEMMAVVVAIVVAIALIALARRIRGTPPVSSKTPGVVLRAVKPREGERRDRL